jgi:DNA-3-methyladenine glycosylase
VEPALLNKRERVLDRDFLARDALVVAPELLNKVLVAGPCAGRIVEVEAYRSDEPAAHSYRGPTPRSAVMFGPAGRLYVYLSYGIHYCANVVTGAEGDGQALLLRAVIPLRGIDTMAARRNGRTPLADGPGKLCQAFALDRSHTGTDLCADGEIRLVDDGTPPPAMLVTTPRVGITKAVDLPWRFLAPPERPTRQSVGGRAIRPPTVG